LGDKKMSITTTKFNKNVYSTEDENIHNVDVFNDVIFYNTKMSAVYQTGLSFCNNDYNKPSNELELSENGGTNFILIEINKLYLKDIEEKNEEANAVLDLLKEVKQDATFKDLKNLYLVLQENHPGSVELYL
jgi:hypothetical protein